MWGGSSLPPRGPQMDVRGSLDARISKISSFRRKSTHKRSFGHSENFFLLIPSILSPRSTLFFGFHLLHLQHRDENNQSKIKASLRTPRTQFGPRKSDEAHGRDQEVWDRRPPSSMIPISLYSPFHSLHSDAIISGLPAENFFRHWVSRGRRAKKNDDAVTHRENLRICTFAL